MECKSHIESLILKYQILNLHGESYKTGIQAGPTIHSFLFCYSPYIFMKMPYYPTFFT